MVRMNQCSYYQIKYKQLSLFFKNTPKCQVDIKSCKHVVFRENPSCENGLKKTNKILILFIEIKKKFPFKQQKIIKTTK